MGRSRHRKSISVKLNFFSVAEKLFLYQSLKTLLLRRHDSKERSNLGDNFGAIPLLDLSREQNNSYHFYSETHSLIFATVPPEKFFWSLNFESFHFLLFLSDHGLLCPSLQICWGLAWILRNSYAEGEREKKRIPFPKFCRQKKIWKIPRKEDNNMKPLRCRVCFFGHGSLFVAIEQASKKLGTIL